MKLSITMGVIIAAAIVAPEIAAQDFEWSGRLGADQTIEIKGINGQITANGTTDRDVHVTASKSGRDRDDVRIEVVEHDRGITICAVYPDRDDGRPNECAPGNGGRMNTEDTRAEVDFEIRVPAGVRFVGKNVNGDVSAHGLTADAVVSSVNGDVDVSTEGWAEASTVNGDIHASMGRANWEGEADFSTVNGSIVLDLPANFSATVEASTVNGEFYSDFPLTVTGRFGPRKITGTIGNGGRRLELSTVNGSIRLNKS